MGQRNYKQVTVYLAFELLLKGDNVVDDKYLAKKLELCKYILFNDATWRFIDVTSCLILCSQLLIPIT